LTVDAPIQVAARLLEVAVTPLPPRDTTPMTALVASSAGPPLSPSQIDSPTANSFDPMP
jgi:hypothetical protein